MSRGRKRHALHRMHLFTLTYLLTILRRLSNMHSNAYIDFDLIWSLKNSFTLHSAYNNVARRNVMLRHCLTHFPPKFRDIACWLPDRINLNNSFSIVLDWVESITIVLTVTCSYYCASNYLSFPPCCCRFWYMYF